MTFLYVLHVLQPVFSPADVTVNSVSKKIHPGDRTSGGVLDFELFCREQYASMTNALSWTLGGRDLGQEATDEALARAYENWGKVSAMPNPAGWVYRVGLNWGKRRIWRRRRELELLKTKPLKEYHQDTFSDPDLAFALNKLGANYRAVIVLRYLLGYSEKDIASALRISKGTVKSRSSRGLKKLRILLAE